MEKRTAKQIERDKRNQSIKLDYERVMGVPFAGKKVRGSSGVIWNLSKKHGISTLSVYNALRGKEYGKV